MHSPPSSSSYEETVVIFWNQGVALNTSYAFNKGRISFGFTVAPNSNSSVLFSLIHATESGYTFDWSPSLVESFTLNPGDSFFNIHSFSTSDRSVALAIWYFCTVLTEGSNATVIFSTTVLNIGQRLSVIGIGLAFLTCVVIAVVHNCIKKRNHLKLV